MQVQVLLLDYYSLIKILSVNILLFVYMQLRRYYNLESGIWLRDLQIARLMKYAVNGFSEATFNWHNISFGHFSEIVNIKLVIPCIKLCQFSMTFSLWTLIRILYDYYWVFNAIKGNNCPIKNVRHLQWLINAIKGGNRHIKIFGWKLILLWFSHNCTHEWDLGITLRIND